MKMEEKGKEAHEVRTAGDLAAINAELSSRAAETEWTPAAGGGGDDQGSAAVFENILKVAFQIVAVRRGAHWALSDDEARNLGEATGAVVDKYVSLEMIGPELTLLVVAGMVVAPRMALDSVEDEKQEAESGKKPEQRAET